MIAATEELILKARKAPELGTELGGTMVGPSHRHAFPFTLPLQITPNA
jgi:hypothetical protein